MVIDISDTDESVVDVDLHTDSESDSESETDSSEPGSGSDDGDGSDQDGDNDDAVPIIDLTGEDDEDEEPLREVSYTPIDDPDSLFVAQRHPSPRVSESPAPRPSEEARQESLDRHYLYSLVHGSPQPGSSQPPVRSGIPSRSGTASEPRSSATLGSRDTSASMSVAPVGTSSLPRPARIFFDLTTDDDEDDEESPPPDCFIKRHLSSSDSSTSKRPRRD